MNWKFVFEKKNPTRKLKHLCSSSHPEENALRIMEFQNKGFAYYIFHIWNIAL